MVEEKKSLPATPPPIKKEAPPEFPTVRDEIIDTAKKLGGLYKWIMAGEKSKRVTREKRERIFWMRIYPKVIEPKIDIDKPLIQIMTYDPKKVKPKKK